MNTDLALEIFKTKLTSTSDYFSHKKFKIYELRNQHECKTLLIFMKKLYPTITLTQSYRLLRVGIFSELRCKSLTCTNTVTTDNRANNDNHQFSYYCCADCGNRSSLRIEKIRETKNDLYGGNGFELESHRKIACATMKEKYGVEWYTTATDFWIKVADTSLEKYGTKHPYQSLQVQKKYRDTMVEKYGIEHPLVKGSQFRDKALDTVEKKFGDRQIMRTSYLKSLKESQGLRIPDSERSAYELYHKMVWDHTNITISTKEIKNINLRGRLDLNDNAYHLDHQVSIYEGFIQNVPANIIGSEHNLEMIPARENCRKGKRSSLSVEDLFNLTRYNR